MAETCENRRKTLHAQYKIGFDDIDDYSH